MYDQYKRRINYLRISITDRCNLRCVYCMPAEGIPLLPHNDILSFDEIESFTRYAVSQGIDKVRITGGEPLVRKGIVELIERLGRIKGIRDFGMTTNGIYLPKYAQALAGAGLDRINISLDTMDSEKFKQITRLGNIEDVFAGIEAAKSAGLLPIKINCVIHKSSDEPDAKAVAEYCKENDLMVRYIREMDLEHGYFWQVQGGEGGACKSCNRLRLTANGKIKPCLFSDLEYDIRKLGSEKAIELALANKPKVGTINHVNHFNNIGG